MFFWQSSPNLYTYFPYSILITVYKTILENNFKRTDMLLTFLLKHKLFASDNQDLLITSLHVDDKEFGFRYALSKYTGIINLPAELVNSNGATRRFGDYSLLAVTKEWCKTKVIVFSILEIFFHIQIAHWQGSSSWTMYWHLTRACFCLLKILGFDTKCCSLTLFLWSEGHDN